MPVRTPTTSSGIELRNTAVQAMLARIIAAPKASSSSPRQDAPGKQGARPSVQEPACGNDHRHKHADSKGRQGHGGQHHAVPIDGLKRVAHLGDKGDEAELHAEAEAATC